MPANKVSKITLLFCSNIPLTLEISTDAQSLIGFGVICEGYICYPSGGRACAAQAPKKGNSQVRAV